MKHESIKQKKDNGFTRLFHLKPVVERPGLFQPPLLGHHRNVGNRAILRLLESRDAQAKLKIGSPNDKYEQEADRVAGQMMRMEEKSLVNGQWSLGRKGEESTQTKPLAEQITPLVQRQPEEEEEEPVQTKSVQRQFDEEEEEESVQSKTASGSTPKVTTNIESSINSMKGGGQPLSESTRNFFEPRFGADFSQVRIHTDSRAAQTAQSINAKAFTTGKDIVFNSGQYSPNTTPGKNLLAHELTHVVQQDKERVQCKNIVNIGRAYYNQEAKNTQFLIFANESKNNSKKYIQKTKLRKKNSIPFFANFIEGNTLDIYMQKAPANINKTPIRQVISKLNHFKIDIIRTIIKQLKDLKKIAEKPESEQIETWEEKHRGRLEKKKINKYKSYKESGEKLKDETVRRVYWARTIINSLTAKELGVENEVLEKIKGFYHRQINTTTPYYTQKANADILSKVAYDETCSVTSLAMALNALGIRKNDFIGKMEVLRKIGLACYKNVKISSAISLRLGFSDLLDLRFPDFLQLVAIYVKYEEIGGKEFDKRVEKAKTEALEAAYGGPDIFKKIAKLFGVKASLVIYRAKHENDWSELENLRKVPKMAKKKENIEYILKRLKSLLKKKKKLRRYSKRFEDKLKKDLKKKLKIEKQLTIENIEKIISDLKEETDKLEGKLKTAQNPKKVIVEGYRNWVTNRLEKEGFLTSGTQIIVNKYGHYVRLERFDNKRIIIDDPDYLGKNKPIEWKEAYLEAFFAMFIVLKK